MRFLDATMLKMDLKNPPRRPSMDRRIQVAKSAFIGRQLAVRMHVPFAGNQQKLPLSKFRIDDRKRQSMKRQVPGGKPRIFPLIRHRKYFRRVEMLPIMVAAGFSWPRRRRISRIALEPIPYIKTVPLFAQYPASARLP